MRLPALPSYTAELNRLLDSEPIDLTLLARLIATQPRLCRGVQRAGRGLGLALPDSTVSERQGLDRAVILLGSDRLRALALSAALLEWMGAEAAMEYRPDLWIRFFLTAGLSRRLAQGMHYPRPEQAYLAGLAHDIGLVPLLGAAPRRGESAGHAPSDLDGSLASIPLERGRFGFDHCQMGAWIGRVWNFPADLIEVFELHHCPSRATIAGDLVHLVAAGDELCRHFAGVATPFAAVPAVAASATPILDILARYLPGLTHDRQTALADDIEAEYFHQQLALDFTAGPASNLGAAYPAGANARRRERKRR